MNNAEWKEFGPDAPHQKMLCHWSDGQIAEWENRSDDWVDGKYGLEWLRQTAVNYITHWTPLPEPPK